MLCAHGLQYYLTQPPAGQSFTYTRKTPFFHEHLATTFRGQGQSHPQRLDYLNEALALERQGDYEAALTSYRLAYRDNPNDARIMLNMAIAFTKTAQQEEAIRLYRRALEVDPTLVGAHYGLAFLLLKRGDSDAAPVTCANSSAAAQGYGCGALGPACRRGPAPAHVPGRAQ